jgi:hypothetical protein
MALRAEFTMHHSGYEQFLSAPIWEEKNGALLSMLSALARLGVDPWGEAARLANMPREGAAAALATLLARLPRNGVELPDYAELAQHLVEFLPQRGSATSADQQGNANGRMDIGNIKTGLILALAAVLIILQVNGWLF